MIRMFIDFGSDIVGRKAVGGQGDVKASGLFTFGNSKLWVCAASACWTLSSLSPVLSPGFDIFDVNLFAELPRCFNFFGKCFRELGVFSFKTAIIMAGARALKFWGMYTSCQLQR